MQRFMREAQSFLPPSFLNVFFASLLADSHKHKDKHKDREHRHKEHKKDKEKDREKSKHSNR